MRRIVVASAISVSIVAAAIVVIDQRSPPKCVGVCVGPIPIETLALALRSSARRLSKRSDLPFRIAVARPVHRSSSGRDSSDMTPFGCVWMGNGVGYGDVAISADAIAVVHVDAAFKLSAGSPSEYGPNWGWHTVRSYSAAAICVEAKRAALLVDYIDGALDGAGNLFVFRWNGDGWQLERVTNEWMS